MKEKATQHFEAILDSTEAGDPGDMTDIDPSGDIGIAANVLSS